MRLGTVARHWEDWAIGTALVLFAAVVIGLVLLVSIDSILSTVVAFTFIGFLTLMGVVGAFGR